MVRHPRESGARPRSGQAQNSDSKAGKGSRGAVGVPEKGERVAKALARAGIASRREVERLINLGKVAVNGRILDTPAVLVKRDDILTVDGQVVNEPEPTRLWRYHKPVGLVTTHKDPQDRPTVFDNLPEGLPRVLSVGRLDLNSEGLLLLTNDGELARALELPANAWRRVYRARALGHATQEKLDRLKDGITVEGVHYGPIEAKLDKAQGANVWITVSLNEGKNREVRRVLEAIGLKVNRLIRLAYGPFLLGTLGHGEVEEVGPRVIREQLADFIAPENMPTGDRVATPPPAAARRAKTAKAAAAPLHRPVTGDPLADPYRKPSRVRATAERVAAEQAGEERPRAGGARPGPAERRRAAAARSGSQAGEARTYRKRDDEQGERPRGAGAGRPFRKREDEGFGARPRRRDDEGYGARPSRGPRREDGEGADRRPPRQRDEGGYGARPARGPRREASEGADRRPPRKRDEGYGARPVRGPRREEGEGADRRPARKRDEGYGARPARGPRREEGEGAERRPARKRDEGYGARPARGRREDGEGGYGARREGGDERRGPKPGWAKSKPRPQGARPDRRRDEAEGERPFRPARPRPEGAGRSRPAGREGGEGDRAERPQRPFKPRGGDKRPGGPGRRGEPSDRPRGGGPGRPSGPPRKPR